ncbi:MAG: hypothetical protein AAF488_19765, partial [Planctomycetota bacterium]
MNAPTRFGMIAALAACVQSYIIADPGDLVRILDSPCEAPVDLAYDTSTDTYWVSTFTGGAICQLNSTLDRELARVEAPFDNPLFATATGLAVDSRRGRLYVADARSATIHELTRGGQPTGRVIPVILRTDVEPSFIAGLAFNPRGAGGRGTLFTVDQEAGIIYEVDLTGRTLRSFPDPEDPERFLGDGSSPSLSDVDLIFDELGNLSGFYVSAAFGAYYSLLELDLDGRWTGVRVRLAQAGADGSALTSIARRNFARADG